MKSVICICCIVAFFVAACAPAEEPEIIQERVVYVETAPESVDTGLNPLDIDTGLDPQEVDTGPNPLDVDTGPNPFDIDTGTGDPEPTCPYACTDTTMCTLLGGIDYKGETCADSADVCCSFEDRECSSDDECLARAPQAVCSGYSLRVPIVSAICSVSGTCMWQYGPAEDCDWCDPETAECYAQPVGNLTGVVCAVDSDCAAVPPKPIQGEDNVCVPSSGYSTECLDLRYDSDGYAVVYLIAKMYQRHIAECNTVLGECEYAVTSTTTYCVYPNPGFREDNPCVEEGEARGCTTAFEELVPAAAHVCY